MTFEYRDGKPVFCIGDVYGNILDKKIPYLLKQEFIRKLKSAYEKLEKADDGEGESAAASTPQNAEQNSKSPTGLTVRFAAASTQGDGRGGSSSMNSSPKKVGKGR